MIFFNSVKEINRLRKEIDRLLSTGMLEVTMEEKNWRSQNLDFLGFKHHWIFKFLVAT